MDQAREVMVFGDSGIMSVCPPDRRPDWIATRHMFVWSGTVQQTTRRRFRAVQIADIDAATRALMCCP
ncbi:MAG: phage terminase large subunit-like protein [Yoonia sp.]|jgi:phage terminase large subunit-like protein